MRSSNFLIGIYEVSEAAAQASRTITRKIRNEPYIFLRSMNQLFIPKNRPKCLKTITTSWTNKMKSNSNLTSFFVGNLSQRQKVVAHLYHKMLRDPRGFASGACWCQWIGALPVRQNQPSPVSHVQQNLAWKARRVLSFLFGPSK